MSGKLKKVVMFIRLSILWNSNYRRTVKSISAHQNVFGPVEMMFGLVNVSFSLPKWQAVKMTFFARWILKVYALEET